MNLECAIPDDNPPSKIIGEILSSCRSIAVVGISHKKDRDSNRVSRYLAEMGYQIVPVNTGQKEILGQPCFKRLADIPFHVDVANLFLNPKRIPSAVDQAIDLGVRVIWMQRGIVHNAAAKKAKKAGIHVIMNKCLMAEHMKLLSTNV
jgi:predicted CoA-binding protein